MRFFVDSDLGHAITGWLIPDNPNDRSRVLVCLPDRDPVEIEASISRPDIVALSLHITGLCGFSIDEAQFPGLRHADGLELRDAVTNILLHRRFDSARHLARKLMFMDASVLPPRSMLDNMRQYFATPYASVEGLTYETLYSMIYIHQSNSVLLSGRPYFMRQITGLKERGYVVAALLRDPFEELAERLLFFSLLARTQNPAPLMSYATGLHPLADFARTIDLSDEKSLAAMIRRASPEHRALMRDPMTRMLACEPDEKATRHHVTRALDNLSSIDVVGTRERFADFNVIFTDVIGADILGARALEPSVTVARLANQLSKVNFVQNLLEQDLALYSYAAEAFDAGFSTARAHG